MTNTSPTEAMIYEVDGSIYEGMAACVSVTDPSGIDGRRTIAHCPVYGDALEIADAMNTRASLPAPTDEVVERVAAVLKQYAAAFFIDCGDGEAGMLERAAEKLAEYVVTAIGDNGLVADKAALFDMLSEMLAASRCGGVHFAVEPEPSGVDTSFAKRCEAHAMSALLTAVHPVDDEGCFIHKRPITEDRCNEIIASAVVYGDTRRALLNQSKR